MGVFEKTIAEGDQLLDLIPQRDPIVMVDKLYGVDGNISYAGLTVCADNMFCENGYLNESGIIEHIAQSAAARYGYICKQNGKAVPAGFIGALKNIEIKGLPAVGEELCTTLTIKQDVFGITLVDAEVRAKTDRLICTGELRIVVKEE